MLPNGWPRPRFRLNSLFILMLGIAIGYALNLQTWRLLTGPRSETAMSSLPTYVIEPPDVLRIQVAGKHRHDHAAFSGERLVAMDGRVDLGDFGSVYIAGMTIAEARDAIAKAVARRMESPRVLVDVAACNSKVYYVIQKGGPGFGDDVTRLPITGNETALDAIAQIGGLNAPEATELWIARPAPNGVGAEKILPIDWKEISAAAETTTNYQLLPGDRVIISRDFSTAVNR